MVRVTQEEITRFLQENTDPLSREMLNYNSQNIGLVKKQVYPSESNTRGKNENEKEITRPVRQYAKKKPQTLNREAVKAILKELSPEENERLRKIRVVKRK